MFLNELDVRSYARNIENLYNYLRNIDSLYQEAGNSSFLSMSSDDDVKDLAVNLYHLGYHVMFGDLKKRTSLKGKRRDREVYGIDLIKLLNK